MAKPSDDKFVQRELRALRQRAGLSMTKLARAAGYKGASSYQRYEDENETFTFLPISVGRKLAKALVGKGAPPIQPAEVMALCGVVFEGDKIVGVEFESLDEIINDYIQGEQQRINEIQSVPQAKPASNEGFRWSEQVGAIIEDELAAAKVTLSVSQRFELLATISRAVERIGELINSGVSPEAAMRHVRDAIGEVNDVGT